VSTRRWQIAKSEEFIPEKWQRRRGAIDQGNLRPGLIFIASSYGNGRGSSIHRVIIAAFGC
jgi:hypothetical protein